MEDGYLHDQPPPGYQTVCRWDPVTKTMRRQMQRYMGGKLVAGYDQRTIELVKDEPMQDYESGDTGPVDSP